MIISGLGVLLIPMSVHAYSIDPTSVMALCNYIPCGGGGGGAQGLSMYIFEKIVVAMEVGIISAAIISLFIASVQMVMFSSEESTVNEARTSYIYIITGLAIIGLAHWIVSAFSPTETGIALVNTGFVTSGICNVVTYFKAIIAITLTVNIVIQSIRLISSHGEDEQVNKAKTRFIAGFIGAGIIMLANVIAVAMSPENSVVTSCSYEARGSASIAFEMAGIANYLLMILGFLALLAIVVAGVLLIVSVDETLKDKAKNIVKTSIMALIVVLVSYALVTAFILI